MAHSIVISPDNIIVGPAHEDKQKGGSAALGAVDATSHESSCAIRELEVD
jgi:hypothetical protein